MDTASSNTYSEATHLLFDRVPQSMYDGLQPPAYDDINGFPQNMSVRRRFLVRLAALFLVTLVGMGCLSAYYFKKSGAIPTQPPKDPVTQPAPPITPSPPPSPAPLPQLPSFPDPLASYVPPTSGRSDLCHPWAYVPLDSRPTDRLLYTVPSLLPIRIESASICLTPSGQLGFCSNSDDPISGKLQVIGADIELPQIEVSLRRGVDDGLENVSVCLMRSNDTWVLGLYVLGDEFTPLSQGLTPSASILVKLPYSQVHNLSTNLDHFTQAVGSSTLTETNTLTFDTLEFYAEGRGGLEVQNVAVATMYAKVEVDNMEIRRTRITRLLRLESENGFFLGNVTLVHQDDSPPVRVDVQTTFGTISVDATLEYSARSKTAPQFDINLSSIYSPAVAYIRDPQGMDLLAAQRPLVVSPILRTNVTSRYALAQASIPATYHGSIELSSEFAAIATNDRARALPGRRVSWNERVGMMYRGVAEWTVDGVPRQAGHVAVSTQFATTRLMFLGLMDRNTDLWQDEGTVISYIGQ